MKSVEIIRSICDEMEVAQSKVMSDLIWPELVEARRRIAIRLRLDLKWSYPRIARVIKRDSSTVQTLVKGRRMCAAGKARAA